MGNLKVTYPDQSFFLTYNSKAKVLTFSLINQTLLKFGQNDSLTLKNYNECLFALTQDPNFPQWAYTFLAERLFNLLDKEKINRISFDSFKKGLCMALSCQDTRARILYEAMKIDEKKSYLTLDDVCSFFYQSLINNFNYVYIYTEKFFKNEFLQKQIPIPNSQEEFLALVQRHAEQLKSCIVRSWCDSGINVGQQITIEVFKQWALKDNTIEINYANKVFKFATSTLFMEAIGLNCRA